MSTDPAKVRVDPVEAQRVLHEVEQADEDERRFNAAWRRRT